MAIRNLIIVTIILGFSLASCTNPNNKKANSETTAKDTLTNSNVKDMKSYISMFEIPATDISRAVNFYQAILDIKIEKMDVEGMQMGILPYEDQLVTGVIIKADGYKPSADGVTIYLNGGDNLQIILDKVEKSGGKILTQKTAHADGSGFFAIFIDSEGNKMALNSPN
ncbi:VOC family protein [Flavobacterium galactosidilyticum]|uniref:VOC family protein n=1 Tax=Flavobacterium galactosidilyticum TaxID=2893886 RepID=UPI001E3B73DB|nr:VOC family protein [Flavobacterium sp. F-340]UFH46627.1 VOC family protein [Flavobacterium sp. F-340]